MGRITAREELFKAIYEYAVVGEKNVFSFETLIENLDVDDREYVVKCYYGIVDDFENIKSVIAKYSSRGDGFEIDRVYKIDFAILCVAIYELKNKLAPNAVIANEAIELAKKYSTDKSYSFVNGIIASVIKEGL